MAREIAATHHKQLKRIQKNVESAQKYFKNNITNFHKYRKQVYQTALTRDEIADLDTLGKPPLEFNIVEAYISRLKGEFSKQTPSPRTFAKGATPVDGSTLQVVDGYFRAIQDDADQEGFSNSIYAETLSGGYSIIKIWTEYESSMSFDQKIFMGKVYDPTLAGFDPLARLPSKSDAEYCYELFPRTKDDFEKEYPDIKTKHLSFTRQSSGFNWSYRQNDIDIVLICDYYEKKKTKKTIYRLANHEVLDQDEYTKLLAKYEGVISEPPAIAEKRTAEFESVCRYRFIDDVLLDYTTTDFESLPLIFADGNSAILNENDSSSNDAQNSRQLTRPYVYHAMDMQKLKNFAGQTLANELENMVMHKFIAEEASISDKYLSAWINPQMASTLIWKSRDKDGQPLQKPEAVPRVPIPQEVFGTFESADKTIQNILGSYDAALGINKNQLSGIALVEGATQSNNTAMPYVMNYLTALTQAYNVILELIPKYYKTPRTIPVLDQEGTRKYIQINQPQTPQFNFDSKGVGVRVKAGVNFEVQKNRSLQTITQLMQASEGFKAMIEQFGLPILVDNLDIRGQEELKQMASKFMQMQDQKREEQQKMAQQGQMNNPQTQLVQIEGQKAAVLARKQEAEARYQEQRVMNDKQKLELEEYKAQLAALEQRQNHLVALARAETERDGKAADIELQQIKQDDVAMRELSKFNQ